MKNVLRRRSISSALFFSRGHERASNDLAQLLDLVQQQRHFFRQQLSTSNQPDPVPGLAKLFQYNVQFVCEISATFCRTRLLIIWASRCSAPHELPGDMRPSIVSGSASTTLPTRTSKVKRRSIRSSGVISSDPLN